MFMIRIERTMSDTCLEPNHNFDYFDSDDIDSFEFDRVSEQLKEAKEDLDGCDDEDRELCKKNIKLLEGELDDIKAGY